MPYFKLTEEFISHPSSEILLFKIDGVSQREIHLNEVQIIRNYRIFIHREKYIYTAPLLSSLRDHCRRGDRKIFKESDVVDNLKVTSLDTADIKSFGCDNRHKAWTSLSQITS